MREINISPDAVKLFSHVLDFYINHQNEWYDDFDEIWSCVFGMKNQLSRTSYEDGLISETERDQEFLETDSEIGAWVGRLSDWQYKRYYLKQYLDFLRRQLREVKHAFAS